MSKKKSNNIKIKNIRKLRGFYDFNDKDNMLEDIYKKRKEKRHYYKIKSEIVEKDSKSSEKMKFIGKTCIKIDRELSDLDRFALNFTNILKKHTSYVVVSGYVSILLGRARASEDIDIIIPKNKLPKFKLLYQDLKENNFYCLNAEKDTTIYSNLKDGIAIRIAKKDEIIPNIELKFAKNKFDDLALQKTISIKLLKGQLNISNLELQIAYKEAVLKSPKDKEDARHLRMIAKEYIDDDLIQEYKEQLDEFFYKRKSKR